MIMNRTVLLECPVSGIPPPAVLWLKNGEPLRAVDNKVEIYKDGRRVKIHTVKVEDTARYTCIVSNEAGDLRRDFNLEVLGML